MERRTATTRTVRETEAEAVAFAMSQTIGLNTGHRFRRSYVLYAYLRAVHPFSSSVVNVRIRNSTYVLDGLLHHEYDLRIEEHYMDTGGFTDHVFGLMHLHGFSFALPIRDLSDTRLYT